MAKKSADPDSVSVNIDDFQKTRDSVIVALATLQSSVQELSRAYIHHANTVLAPGKVGALNTSLTNVLNESGLLTGQPIVALPAIENPDEGGKKKRKRQPHDPNAPKRALTPYFLYMQHARAHIHKELGDQARPKEVADEGTRRWGEMTAGEKSVWDDRYQKNLAAYRVRMAAYKAGEPVPSEENAAALVEAGKAAEIITSLDGAIESEEEVAAADPVAETSEESEPEPEPEPEREPSPPKSKRRKSEKKSVSAVEETPKETPKPKANARKAKKEPSPVPAKPASEKRKTKARKG